MSIKEKIKNCIPKSAWDLIRKMWFSLKEFMEQFESEEKTIVYSGIILHYNRGNSVITRLKNEKVYEEEMCVHMVNSLLKKEKPVLMDIGSNIGLVTSYVIEKVPNIFIYAFEPGPKQAELLRKTITTNSLGDRILLTEVALSDRSGRQTFYSHPLRDQAKDGLFDTKRGEKTVKIEVETITLDEWWKKAGKPHIDMLKIDTEGAELLVLKGASQFLKEVHPVMYLEISMMNLHAYPYKGLDILNFLERENFRLETLKKEVVTQNNLENLIKENDTFLAYRHK